MDVDVMDQLYRASFKSLQVDFLLLWHDLKPKSALEVRNQSKDLPPMLESVQQ